jgi:hypothetical protein
MHNRQMVALALRWDRPGCDPPVLFMIDAGARSVGDGKQPPAARRGADQRSAALADVSASLSV